MKRISSIVYFVVKQYKDLSTKYEHEPEENKKLLIDLVTKSILATEKNTQAIDAIRDAIHRK